MFKLFDKKAQAGSVFKLLVGAVIGLAIFGIILSVIMMMDNQKTYLSDQVFSNKLLMAMKNPTGKDFIIDDYSIAKNTIITKKGLAEKTGLGENCIEFIKPNIPENIIAYSESYFSFKKDYVLDFAVNCNVNNEDCPILCTLRTEDRGFSNQVIK